VNESLKARAMDEFKLYWFCTVYLFIALGTFMLYRRLVLAEAGVPYLNYGIAAVEAMIIAKVVLIGRALHLGKRYEGAPLAASVAYKSIVFGVIVLLFGVLEHVVTGLLRHRTGAQIVDDLFNLGIYELLARMLMMMIAFVPMFAFWELGRVVGTTELRDLFLKRQRPHEAEVG